MASRIQPIVTTITTSETCQLPRQFLDKNTHEIWAYFRSLQRQTQFTILKLQFTGLALFLHVSLRSQIAARCHPGTAWAANARHWNCMRAAGDTVTETITPLSRTPQSIVYKSVQTTTSPCSIINKQQSYTQRSITKNVRTNEIKLKQNRFVSAKTNAPATKRVTF